MCLENVIYITKQEKVSIYYLIKPVFGRICSREAKTKFRQCDWSAKKFAAKKLDQPTLLLVASREQIRPVENVILVIVILFPVKYLRMTSLTSTNVFTISCLSIEHAPPPLFGKFSSTARWKALQSLYCTIRRLFVLFVDYSYYSSTNRTIRRLFVLFVD